MADSFAFFLLHSRKYLLQETAFLVNKEWPRSLAARLASIEEGCDELPCSIVMVDANERVVGHARLMPVAGSKDAALIETVIVAPELRGKGLGRQLMEEAERHSVKVGYTSLHLSTHDKQGFYSRLGYRDGPVVSGRRKCVAKLSEDQTQSLLGTGECDDSPPDQSAAPPPVDVAPLLAVGPAPPPPPPPPKLLVTSKTVTSEVITWMAKPLS